LIGKYGPKRVKLVETFPIKNSKYRISKGKRPKLLDKYLKDLEKYRYHVKNKPAWIEAGYSAWCAVRIQASWRMSKTFRRMKYKKMVINQIGIYFLIYFPPKDFHNKK